MNVNPKREGFIDVDQPEPAAAPNAKRATAPPTIEPSPAEQPDAEERQLWPMVVKLRHKSIRNNKGDQVNELSLREPRAADINRNGNPVRVNGEFEVVIEERKMTYMIAALSGILVPFIDEMDPRDWNTTAYKLRGFFLPDLRDW